MGVVPKHSPRALGTSAAPRQPKTRDQRVGGLTTQSHQRTCKTAKTKHNYELLQDVSNYHLHMFLECESYADKPCGAAWFVSGPLEKIEYVKIIYGRKTSDACTTQKKTPESTIFHLIDSKTH